MGQIHRTFETASSVSVNCVRTCTQSHRHADPDLFVNNVKLAK
jgi:hypothetical protein